MSFLRMRRGGAGWGVLGRSLQGIFMVGGLLGGCLEGVGDGCGERGGGDGMILRVVLCIKSCFAFHADDLNVDCCISL